MGLPDLLQRVVRRAMVLEVHLAAFLPTEGSQRRRNILCVLCRRHLIKSLFRSYKTRQTVQISPQQNVCGTDSPTTTTRSLTEAVRGQTIQQRCCVSNKVNNTAIQRVAKYPKLHGCHEIRVFEPDLSVSGW